MAEKVGGKKGRRVRKREKKQSKGKKHSSVSVQKVYSVDGGKIKRNLRSCPRCGPGTSLSQHKNRAYCGKCAYTELKKSD